MEYFGKTRKQEEMHLYTLQNHHGMKMMVTDYGAIITQIWVPDRDGKLRDIVLGYDHGEEYENDMNAFGALVGRNANRIAGGRFSLNGKDYFLSDAFGGHNLHSGPDFYHKRIWRVEIIEEDRITLSLISPDGDQGFPGELSLKVSYWVTDNNSVRVEYEGISNQDTILNPTNHSYFNLDGVDTENTRRGKISVLQQYLQIYSDQITASDKDSIPTGELRAITGTPMDFQREHQIGERIGVDYDQLLMGKGYDHNYILKENRDQKRIHAATMRSEASGISMDIYTDREGMQIYTGNYIEEGTKGKRNCLYGERSGIAFETQGFPDAPNHKNFPSTVWKAGEAYRSVTEYCFTR